MGIFSNKNKAFKEIEKHIREMSKQRSIVFRGSRPNNDDYGYSPENPICTSSIEHSSLYLERLRLEDGSHCRAHREGSINMAELNGAKNISVDIYKIISENSEKMIYICPYAHDSSIAPKGFKLVSEEFIKNEPWSLKNFMVDFAVDEKTALRLRQLDLKEVFDELKYNKPTDYTWDRYYKEYASFINTLKEAGYILVDGGIEKNTQSEISSVDNNRNEDSQIHSEPNHESYDANKEVTYIDFSEKENDPKNITQTEVLFCRKCGNKLIQGSKFCNKCGTKVI